MVNPPPRQGECGIVTGKKRDGKSWWSYHEVFLEFQGPAIYIDPKGADGYIGGFCPVHGDHGIPVVHTLEELQRLRPNKVILQIVPGARPEAFDDVIDRTIDWLIAWKSQPEMRAFPLLVVIDEGQRLMTKMKMNSQVDRLVQTCSALNISTIIINPDYSTIPRQLFVQSDYITLFTCHPVILMYFEERLRTEFNSDIANHMGRKYAGLIYDWTDCYFLEPDGTFRHYSSILDMQNKEEKKNEDESVQDRGPDSGRDGPEPEPAHVPADAQKPISEQPVRDSPDGGR